MTAKQFCRTLIHSCTPAVTLTFGEGTRRLHWCADHAADANPYREAADTDACGTVVYDLPIVTICGRPFGHDDAIGHAAVRYPEGTPEYDAYRAELRAALANLVLDF